MPRKMRCIVRLLLECGRTLGEVVPRTCPLPVLPEMLALPALPALPSLPSLPPTVGCLYPASDSDYDDDDDWYI